MSIKASEILAMMKRLGFRVTGMGAAHTGAKTATSL